MSLAAVIERLDRSALVIQPYFDLDPEVAARPYAPGKWTAHEMLIHIADVEVLWFDRIRRVLADAKPLLWAIDPDRWNSGLDARHRSLAIAGDLFCGTRAALIEVLRGAGEAKAGMTGVHTERGVLTLLNLAEKTDWHAMHHLAQVQAAAAGRTWTPA